MTIAEKTYATASHSLDLARLKGMSADTCLTLLSVHVLHAAGIEATEERIARYRAAYTRVGRPEWPELERLAELIDYQRGKAWWNALAEPERLTWLLLAERQTGREYPSVADCWRLKLETEGRAGEGGTT